MRATATENFRREPNGPILAVVAPGAVLPVASRDARWVEADLTGWVWGASTQADARAGFDVVVSARGGENLRLEPSGSIVARLQEGTLLEEVDRRPGWIRVRRRGWIWGGSVAVVTPTTEATERPLPAAGPGTEVADPVEVRPGDFVTTPPEGADILTAPGGRPLGRASGATDLEIVQTDGSWARVRVEGWVWLPTADGRSGGIDPVPLTPSELAEEPQRNRGRVVAWTLQFISLEKAQAVRTDFFQGEPYLLTRYGGSDGPFIYVAVPPERVAEVEGLVPLERISVTGRVRSGASAMTGTPIIDLLSLERIRGGG
ncbi:MAG: hypothetical protein OEZ65_00785 [Gemmatimonadota bacterium]|nr:hypothetical protein [Gemmatimonadota bacterium]MDH5758090.1 hypothetical protein [Gemmatimonadota bacterium]